MSEKVIATVAGKELTEADFQEFLRNVPAEQRQYAANPQMKDFFVDQMIAIYMFAKWGEDDKLDETKEYETLMERARRDALSQMAMQKLLASIKVDESELEPYFEANKNRFCMPATVTAKHILTETEESCKDILEKINSGSTTFEDAAKQYSTCPSGQNGGDLGTFGKGQMVKEFEDAAFNAELGKIVGPVKTQFGYHLIKVSNRSEGNDVTFEASKDLVYRTMMKERQQKAYNDKFDELKAKYVK